MKERPILFSGAMARAILEGRKTMTRRVVRGNPVHVTPFIGADNRPTHEFGMHWTHTGVINKHVPCPYGQPGYRLWVRETWGVDHVHDAVPPSNLRPTVSVLYAAEPGWGSNGRSGRWRPSIHMPRWASRLTLEITDVRVQRLHEISEEDARAEGVGQETDDDFDKLPGVLKGWAAHDSRGRKWKNYGEDGPAQDTARASFCTLWQSINGEREGCSWADNPWVWCVSFRRVP